MIRSDLTNEQYHAHEAISSSDVKTVHSTSVLHWKNKVWKDSPALTLGTAVHALVLEPEADLIVRGPEDRRGNKWKEAQAAADLNGQLLLTETDFDKARAMADALLEHPAGQRMAGAETLNERSIFVTDPDLGINLKCRPDSLDVARGFIYDIKTCADASPNGFARAVQTYGYAIQAAFYLHVCRLEGLRPKAFVFACVEKEPPYAVGMHMLTKEYLDWGHSQMMLTLDQIKTAQQSGNFTTGWPEVNYIDLPRWMQEHPAEDFN